MTTEDLQPVSASSTRNARMLVGPYAGILVCALVAMAPIVWSLAHYWASVADYEYGFLIAAVALYWLWAWRLRFSFRPKLNAWYLIALVGVMLLQYCLWAGLSELGAQILFPLVVWLGLATVLDRKSSMLVALPIAYWYFALPVWDEFLPLLQRSTIFGATHLMEMLGVPVHVDGEFLRIAEGTFQVLYACSGLRYLVVALALGYLLFAFVEEMSVRAGAVFLALCAILALIANWIRVVIVMYAGHVTGMSHYFVADSHKGLGNIVFAVLLLLLYLVGRWIARRSWAQETRDSASGGAGSKFSAWLVDVQNWRIAWPVFVVLGCFTFLSLRSALTVASETAEKVTLSAFPVAAGEVQGPLPALSPWMPSFEQSADQGRASYRVVHDSGTFPIEVYVSVYGVQRPGYELVYYKNTLRSPGSWRGVGGPVLADKFRSILGRSLLAEEFVNQDRERWLIAYTYVIAGQRTSSALMAQALYGGSTMLRPSPTGLIAVAVPCAKTCEEAHLVLGQFQSAIGEQIVNMIPAT